MAMADPVIVPAPPSVAGNELSVSATARAAPADRFHELLSEMNPLQYLPVVGTLYRAVTGDTIPQGVREFGSFIVSGLIGGPVGLATSMGLLAIEKGFGLDREAIAQTILSDIGIGNGPVVTPATPQPLPLTFPIQAAAPAQAQTAAAAEAPAAAPVAAPAGAAAAVSTTTTAPAAEHAVAWSPSQLTAYGVTTTAHGTLKRGTVTGADVLNDLELARHHAQDAGAPVNS